MHACTYSCWFSLMYLTQRVGWVRVVCLVGQISCHKCFGITFLCIFGFIQLSCHYDLSGDCFFSLSV